MCTPENLRPLCSCPHLLWRDLRNAARVAAAGAAVAGLWAVIATGYAWVLVVAAFLAIPVTYALAVTARRRSRQLFIGGSNEQTRLVRPVRPDVRPRSAVPGPPRRGGLRAADGGGGSAGVKR
jgi:hypothetical protein